MYKIPRALICRCRGVTPVSAHLSIVDTDAPKCNCRRKMPNVLPEARGTQMPNAPGMQRESRETASLLVVLLGVYLHSAEATFLTLASEQTCIVFSSNQNCDSLSLAEPHLYPAANHHYDRVVEFIPCGIPGRCTITSQRVHLGPRFKSQPQLLTCHHCLPPRSNPLGPTSKRSPEPGHPMSSAGITPSNPMILPRGQPEGCSENVHPAPGGLSSPPPIVLSV